MITSISNTTLERTAHNVFITSQLKLAAAMRDGLAKAGAPAVLKHEKSCPSPVVPTDYAIEACQLLTTAWAGLC